MEQKGCIKSQEILMTCFIMTLQLLEKLSPRWKDYDKLTI